MRSSVAAAEAPQRKYRLAALDLDGTLLGPDRALSPRNAAAVRLLKANGLTVVLASGRRLASTCRFCEERGYHLNHYLNETLYVRELNEWTELYRSRAGTEIEPVGDLARFDGCQPTKLMVVAPPETMLLLRAEISAHYGDRVNVLGSDPEYLEILPRGVNKAFALAAIGRRLGIAPHEMIAFGDGPHDIAMLEYVGLGIAMGNASQAVQRTASRVTGSNIEDGVAQTIEEIFGACPCPVDPSAPDDELQEDRP